jgi:hypothetical protein
VEPDPQRSPRSNRGAQNAEDQPAPAERIRYWWEAGECEAVRRVVGVGFVALRRKRKKQIPRCAPRQSRGGRNDNLRAFARAWAELMVGLAKWAPQAGVAVGRCWDAGVAGERRPPDPVPTGPGSLIGMNSGRRYEGVGSGRCGCF